MNTTPISWTEFLPAALPGSTRIHLARVNPFMVGTIALCEGPKRPVSFIEAVYQLKADAVNSVETVRRTRVNCSKCRERMNSVHRSESEYRMEEDQAYMREDALRAYNARQGEIRVLVRQVKAYRDMVWDRAQQIAAGRREASEIYPSTGQVPFPRVKTEEELAIEAEMDDIRTAREATEFMANRTDSERSLVEILAESQVEVTEEFTNQADFSAPTTDAGHAITFAGNRRFEVGITRVFHTSEARSNRPEDVVLGTVAGFKYSSDDPEIIVRWDGDDRPDADLASEANRGRGAFHHSELGLLDSAPEDWQARVTRGIAERLAEEAVANVRTGRFQVHFPPLTQQGRSPIDRGESILEAITRAVQATPTVTTVQDSVVVPEGAAGDLMARIDSELAQVKERAATIEAWATDANGAPFIPGTTKVLLADEDTSTNRVSVPEPGTVVQSGRGHVHVVWGDPTGASYTYAAAELRIVTGEIAPVQDNRAGLEGLGVPIHRNTGERIRRAAAVMDAAEATPEEAATVNVLRARVAELKRQVEGLKRSRSEYEEAAMRASAELRLAQNAQAQAETTVSLIRHTLNTRHPSE